MKCPRCSTDSSAYETRCVRCGSRFSGTDVSRPPFAQHFGTQAGPVKPFVVSREPRFSQVVPNAVTATPRAVDLQPGLISTESTARDLHRHADIQRNSHLQGHPRKPGDGAGNASSQPQPNPERPESDRRLEVVPPGAQPSLFGPSDYGKRPASLRLERADATNGYLMPAKRKPARRRKKSDMLPFEQGTLGFLTPTSAPVRQLANSVEASVKCEHPVASPAHRMLGAAWDGVVIFFFALALGALFAGIVRALGLNLPTSPAMLATGLGAAIFSVGVAYHALFTLFAWDTPGSRAVGLRLVRFDGQVPSGGQRWLRLGAGIVGLAAAGIGFLWIVFDEESLGWHDHISGTFPTPRIHTESSFRKR